MRRLVPFLVMAALGAVCASAQASSIAFLRDGNIWIANPDGTGAHALTADGGYDYVSAAKVAGSMLLAFRQGSSIGLINADGSAKRTFAPPKGFAASADVAIDPSGHQLDYVAPTGGPVGDYGAVIDVNDSGSSGAFADYDTPVDVGWADTSGTVALWAGFLSTAPGTEHHPDCTPPGGTEQFGIAFQQVYYPPSSATQTTGFFCILGQDVLEPAGSPDGTEVLASAGPSGGDTRIIEIAESTMRSFYEPGPAVPFAYETPSSVDAADPNWSPDGTQFAFDSVPSPGTAPNEIWVSSLGGTPTMILTNASNPAWSPYTLPGSGSGGGSGGGGGNGGGGTGGGGVSIQHPSNKLKLASLLKHGLSVTLSSGSPIAAGVELALKAATARKLKLGHKQVDLGQLTSEVSGSHTFILKIKHKYRAKLRKAKKFTLYVVVATENAAGAKSVRVFAVHVSR